MVDANANDLLIAAHPDRRCFCGRRLDDAVDAALASGGRPGLLRTVQTGGRILSSEWSLAE